MITKCSKGLGPDPDVGGLKPDPCLLGPQIRTFTRQARVSTCRSRVQSAAVTFGELYHSSLKNMQIVTMDYFFFFMSAFLP